MIDIWHEIRMAVAIWFISLAVDSIPPTYEGATLAKRLGAVVKDLA